MKYIYTYLDIENAKEYYEAIDMNFVCFNYKSYAIDKIKFALNEHYNGSINHQYAFASFLYYHTIRKDEIYTSVGMIKNLTIINHVPSLYLYGLMMKDGKVVKDEKTSFDCLKKASRKHFALATFELGKMYHKGEYVKQNIKKGIKLIKKASKECSEAMVYLATWYLKEQSDYKNAMKYYQNAARCGNQKAIKILKLKEENKDEN